MTSATTPSFSALRMFCIFMASITTRFSPARTSWPGLTVISVSSPGMGESRNLERSGGGLGAPVHDAVFQAHTLHLNADIGAVPGTAKQNLAELPVGSQATRLTLIGDIASAMNEAHSQVEPLALHQDDPLVTDPALVALELARGSHRAVDVAAACVGGHRRQQERIVMQQRRGVKALGELFGDEARVEVAG